MQNERVIDIRDWIVPTRFMTTIDMVMTDISKS